MSTRSNVTLKILVEYLISEKIILDFKELQLQLLSHPSYPSLHSITGVLDHFNIDNHALEVPVNMEILNQLPKTFISFFTDKEIKEYILVNRLDEKIEIIFGNKNKKQVSKDDFINIWNGIIVVIDKDDFQNSNNLQNVKSYSNISYAITLFLSVGVFFFFNPSIFQISHYFITLLGILISLLIVKHELGFQSKAVDKFCSSGNKLTNCDAVLNSKGASISKNFKLSDIALIYFTGLTISWIISMQYSNNNSIIIILSLIALPITFYSIYYQYKIVKKWCPLCLTIVTVLWLQISTIFLTKIPITSLKLDLTSSFILFFSFMLVVSLWVFIKPLLKNQIEFNKLRVDHYKFKRNYTLFDAVYQKSPLIKTNISVKNEILLGNINARNMILLITNPSCFYCKQAHTDIENLLRKSDNIKVIIRFNVSQAHENISNKVAQRLLEIYNNDSADKCKKALLEAYKKDADLEKWILNWGITKSNEFNSVLIKQKDWCTANKINFTPAVLLNGKQYPKEYDRSDIGYFIEELAEQFEIERETQKEEVILN